MLSSMSKIKIYTSDSCDHCDDLKTKISDAKKKGKFKCDVDILSYEKNPKPFNKLGIQAVPAIYVDGKEISEQNFFKQCSLKDNSCSSK